MMAIRRVQVSLRILATFVLLVSITPSLMAQNNDSPGRMRNLNNQLLTVYERLLSSPAAEHSALHSQAAAVIQERSAVLAGLIETNPAQALRFAFSQDLQANLSAAFPEAASQLESTGAWEGRLDWVVEMAPDLVKYKDLRRLIVGDQSYNIYFAKEPVGLQCRDALKVEGVRVGGRIAVADANVQVAAAGGCSPVGDQKSVVLLVTFPGVPAPAITPASVYDIFFGSTGTSVNQYWREASYGAASASGAVFGWYTLDAAYTCDQYYAMQAAAIRAADPDVNFTQYNRVFIIFPNPGSCSYAGLGTIGCGTLSSADGNFTASTSWMLANYFTSADYGVKLAAHEGGHNLGLHHSSSRDFGVEALGAPGDPGALSEYGDVFSVMGSWNLGHYPAPHKKMLNWMSESGTIRTVTANGSFGVQPFEMAAGTLQALKIQRGTGGSSWVWLEFRQQMGVFDSTLGSQIFSGATLHYEDSTSGIHTHLLDYTPETASWSDPALAATKSWTDPYTNLSISITSASASSLNVNVTYGPIPCVPASPTVTLSPPNPSVYAGNSAGYTVSVTNNDSAGCASRSFDLSSSPPSGWPAAVFTQAALMIAPAASASTTMTRSVPTGTANGTYQVDATAQNGANSGTGYANVTVVPTPPPLTVTLSIPKTTYPTNSTIPISATVMSGSAAASGASVVITITLPNNTTTSKTVTTGTNGQGTWNYKVNPKGVKGLYTVTAKATYGSQTANTASATTFTVQ